MAPEILVQRRRWLWVVIATAFCVVFIPTGTMAVFSVIIGAENASLGSLLVGVIVLVSSFIMIVIAINPNIIVATPQNLTLYRFGFKTEIPWNTIINVTSNTRGATVPRLGAVIIHVMDSKGEPESIQIASTYIAVADETSLANTILALRAKYATHGNDVIHCPVCNAPFVEQNKEEAFDQYLAHYFDYHREVLLDDIESSKKKIKEGFDQQWK